MSLSEFNIDYQEQFQLIENNMKNRIVYFEMCRTELPSFYPNRHIPCFSMKRSKTIIMEKEETLTVPLEKIYGDGWLFRDKFEYGRPMPERMASLITMTPTSDYPPILCTKLPNGFVYTDDGNHRIYAAYLLGWDTIRFYCYEKYEGSLKEIPETFQ